MLSNQNFEKENQKDLNAQIERLKKENEEMEKLRKENEQYKGLYDVVARHAANLEEDLENRLKQLEYVLDMDSMTGIFNRRKFAGCMIDEVKRAMQIKWPLSLIMFDVDGFNRINNTHGHDAGDAVLIKTARAVQKHLMQGDILARWGGDEFALLLPNTAAERALYVAGVCRNEIASCRYWVDDEVTCSFGVTQMLEKDDARSMVVRAEKALYRAKNLGKNRVAVLKD